MCLAEERRTPQIIGGQRHVVRIVDPVRDMTEREVARNRRDRLGKCPEQLSAHAVVCGSPGGKHKTQLPVDWCCSEVHTGSGRFARSDVLLGSCSSIGELLGIVGHDHKSGWALRRFAFVPQGFEDCCCIGARIDVQRRWCCSARCEMVRCFSKEHRAAHNTIHGGRLDRHGSRASAIR